MKTRLLVATVLAVVAFAACERGGEIITEPGQAPGVAAPTYEVVLNPTRVNAWIDSSFIGFTNPSNATFLRSEETDLLSSRGLVRFGFIGDSLLLGDTVIATIRFDSARVIFDVDSARTVLASGGTTLQLFSITEEWDRGTANWQMAIDSVGIQVPWTDGPGGSYGVLMGDSLMTWEAQTSAGSDSIVIWLDNVDTDSLLRAWLDTAQSNDGLGVLVGDSGSATLSLPRIRYNVVPETDPDTSLEVSLFATDGTFIFDRTAEGSPAGIMRVGGVDGWRSFLEVEVPDTVTVVGVGRVPLRGSSISKAQLFITSLGPPDPPFAADQAFFITGYDLVDDFTVLGAKTPVGPQLIGSDIQLNPESMAAGDTLAVNFTARMQRWSDGPVGSTEPLRLSIRAIPEATTFGFWEFGAADGDQQSWPVIRVVFTLPTEFILP